MRFFQRLNYFTGLFTTADDWRKEQAYHIHKHRLHTRGFHSPGIVQGEGENLGVTVSDDGKVIVLPGYAIDTRGRDLYLAEPITLDMPTDIERSVGKEEVIRYITIAFAEKTRDPRPDHLNPQYSGDAFIEEQPVVEWTREEPNPRDRIELARVRCRTNQRITRTDIDISHVRYAGARHPIGMPVQAASGETRVTKREVKVLVGEPCDRDRAWGSLHVANVFAKDRRQSPITWFMESSINAHGQVDYHLCINTHTDETVEVCYEVYRLNVVPRP